jgi:hypothetical protein
MDELHAQPFYPHPIRFRSRTHQIVDADNADAFQPFHQTFSQGASHKTAHSGDENLHAG